MLHQRERTANSNLLYPRRRELYIPLLLLELNLTIHLHHQMPQSWRLGLAHIQVQLQLEFLQEEFVDLLVYLVGAAPVEEVHQVLVAFVLVVVVAGPYVVAASFVGVVSLVVVASSVVAGSQLVEQLGLVGGSFLLVLVVEHLADVFPEILVAGLVVAFGVVLEEGLEDALVVAFAAFGDYLVVAFGAFVVVLEGAFAAFEAVPALAFVGVDLDIVVLQVGF